MAANDIRIDGAPLRERLRARIRSSGPISFYEWMNAALYDETDGYYFRPDRIHWGRKGDYRTAPESTPLFAATFARYFAKLFGEMGSPSSWAIVEAGAGSGEFALGVLQALVERHPSVLRATRFVIDEVSPANRQRICEKLSAFSRHVDFRALNQIDEPIEGIIFSNELLDAFPVHRLIYRANSWRELYVGLHDDDDFKWVEGELEDQSLIHYFENLRSFSDGQIVEVNSDAENWIMRAAAKLSCGFLISVDYGASREVLLSSSERPAGTLRGFRRHQFVNNLLANPGQQDLTTTVDWTQIKAAGEQAGLRTIRFEGLDEFLMREGLLNVLEQQCDELTNSVEALRLRTSAREMILPQGMAASFQVLVQQRT